MGFLSESIYEMRRAIAQLTLNDFQAFFRRKNVLGTLLLEGEDAGEGLNLPGPHEAILDCLALHVILKGSL